MSLWHQYDALLFVLREICIITLSVDVMQCNTRCRTIVLHRDGVSQKLDNAQGLTTNAKQ